MPHNYYIEKRRNRGMDPEDVILTIIIVAVSLCLVMLGVSMVVRSYRSMNQARAEMNHAHYERMVAEGGYVATSVYPSADAEEGR